MRSGGIHFDLILVPCSLRVGQEAFSTVTLNDIGVEYCAAVPDWEMIHHHGGALVRNPGL